MSSNSPVATLYTDGGLSLSVFKNTVPGQDGEEDRVYYNFIPQKRYFDKVEDTWKSTNSLDLNDLMKMDILFQKAFLEYGVKVR